MNKERKEEIDYLAERLAEEITSYTLNFEGNFGMFKMKAKVFYKEKEAKK